MGALLLFLRSRNSQIRQCCQQIGCHPEKNNFEKWWKLIKVSDPVKTRGKCRNLVMEIVRNYSKIIVGALGAGAGVTFIEIFKATSRFKKKL
ncbi:hypothetical protein Phum_PHUM597320 [Pediculus humanus corporis]|uniref:Uncharacterized protein n=1 Tax=Pediculus humanus subsp. corporis TaxID=121224 RepID=E0W2U9_PEDHC|nr:uncharacterized protein Phum_PHUM597320 [Pediculus humanus corporis]EEB19955.1 hypothetical protein Phum_PHUM597320 [Pediculus humanus corporis]